VESQLGLVLAKVYDQKVEPNYFLKDAKIHCHSKVAVL
jgi:hypothetical protein